MMHMIIPSSKLNRFVTKDLVFLDFKAVYDTDVQTSGFQPYDTRGPIKIKELCYGPVNFQD